MKEYKIYESGEKVKIEVQVISSEINKKGELTYKLKNPQTGYPFDFVFTEDQIFPAGE